jgi:hypothetical protein
MHNQSSAQGGSDAQDQEASVHAGGAAGQLVNHGRTPVRKQILDTRSQAQDGDAHNVLNAKRRGNIEARTVAGYHPRRGGRYDSREDRLPMPEPLGTRVFSREIRTANIPQRFTNPPPSPNTQGKQTLECGSMTTVWLASWAAPPTMQ